MKLTFVLCDTSTVPVWEKPFGPVIAQLTVSIVAPPPRTSDIPTEPPVSFPLTAGSEPPDEEQPAACVAARTASALARRRDVGREADVRFCCDMGFLGEMDGSFKLRFDLGEANAIDGGRGLRIPRAARPRRSGSIASRARAPEGSTRRRTRPP